MFLVLTIHENVVDEMIYIGLDRSIASDHFIDALRRRISNFDEYTPEDIDALLDDCYKYYGDQRSVYFLDLTNTPGVDSFLPKLEQK